MTDMVRAGRPAGARRIEEAIRTARDGGRPALAPFLTAGYPRREGFEGLLRRTVEAADILELGVPFSDPMADGVTVQRASRIALEDGVTLPWILDTVRAVAPKTPVVLMSYLNPLLAHGMERLARDAADAGVAGLIVPDLPLEEAGAYAPTIAEAGLALVHLVSPVTSAERRARIAAVASGFLYAVTVTGTTGGALGDDDDLHAYLAAVRAASPVPVLAGFGVRTAADLSRIAPHVDGAIVGSALIEHVENGGDPRTFLRGLLAEVDR